MFVCVKPHPIGNLPTTFAFWNQNLLAMGIGQVWQETFGASFAAWNMVVIKYKIYLISLVPRPSIT